MYFLASLILEKDPKTYFLLQEEEEDEEWW
jgi:hypothetical protein